MEGVAATLASLISAAAVVARRFQSKPVVNAGHHLRQLCIQRPKTPQHRQPILDSACQRQKRHDLAVEGANGADIRMMWRGIEAEARAKQIKFIDVGGDLAPFHFGLWSRLLK